MNLDDWAVAERYCSVKYLIHSCFHFSVAIRKRFNPASTFFKVSYCIHILHFKIHVRMCKNGFYLTKGKSQFLLKPKSNQQKLKRWNEERQTLVHAISKLQVFEIKSTLFCLFCLAALVSTKVGACSLPSSAVLFPQNQMNAMVRHAGGKHQAGIVFAVKAIEPWGDSWKETGASFGFAVGWQRPTACDGFSPQVHYIQVVVVKQ